MAYPKEKWRVLIPDMLSEILLHLHANVIDEMNFRKVCREWKDVESLTHISAMVDYDSSYVVTQLNKEPKFRFKNPNRLEQVSISFEFDKFKAKAFKDTVFIAQLNGWWLGVVTEAVGKDTHRVFVFNPCSVAWVNLPPIEIKGRGLIDDWFFLTEPYASPTFCIVGLFIDQNETDGKLNLQSTIFHRGDLKWKWFDHSVPITAYMPLHFRREAGLPWRRGINFSKDGKFISAFLDFNSHAVFLRIRERRVFLEVINSAEGDITYGGRVLLHMENHVPNLFDWQPMISHATHFTRELE